MKENKTESPTTFRFGIKNRNLKKAFDKAASKNRKGNTGVIIPALKQYLLGEDENGVFVVKK